MDKHTSETYEDIGALDASNPRTPRVDPQEKEVRLDHNQYYDMTGEKILIILNQRTFMKTRYFGRRKPSFREGTNIDKEKLEKLFKHLGFKVIVLHNHQYHDIIQKLTAIATTDHTRTSCIFIAILTHGGTGGVICAADRPYLLSEVRNIFEKEESLVGKPKIYFVQACRGRQRDDGRTAHLSSQRDEGLVPLRSPSRKLEMDAGRPDDDTLVLYACAEGYISHRNSNGSWLIQALCSQIQALHKTEDIRVIINSVIVEVSGKTTNSKLEEKKNKKQKPQPSYNLMKKLKF